MYLDVAKKRINITFFLISVLKSGARTKRKVRYIIRNHATNVATKFKTLSSCRTFAIEIENTPRFCQLARPRYLPSAAAPRKVSTNPFAPRSTCKFAHVPHRLLQYSFDKKHLYYTFSEAPCFLLSIGVIK